MTKKISIAILSIIFIFVFAPAVFASMITSSNTDLVQGVFSYDFGGSTFYVSDMIIQPLAGADFTGSFCEIGQTCNASQAVKGVYTGNASLDIGETVDGTANIILIGDYISGGIGANASLTTIMGAIITSSVDLTVSVFTTYWPYVLVIGIIAGLIIVFARLTGLGIGNRKY